MTGTELRRLRLLTGLTWRALADRLGRHWRTIARWEAYRDETLPIGRDQEIGIRSVLRPAAASKSEQLDGEDGPFEHEL